MPRKKNCKETVIKGGNFEWRCIREEHKDDRPNSHVFEAHRIVAEKTST